MALRLLNNDSNGDIKAIEHITEVSKSTHPTDCQCIECSDRLFGVVSRGIGTVEDTQTEILKRSKTKDEELIYQANKIASKTSLNKEQYKKQLNTWLTKSLTYITAGGITLLSLNVIIRAMFVPSLAVISASAIGIVVLALVNERIR